MKKILMAVFTMSLVLVLAACSSSTNSETTPTPAPTTAVTETPAATPEQKEEPAAEEKTEETVALNPDGAFKVVLVDSGTDTLKVVAAVRNELNTDLTGAKDLVDNIPSVLKEQLTLAEAEALKAILEEQGATVELQETEKIAVEVKTGVVNVVLTDAGAAKLNVVKEIKNQFELGLAESKELVDNVPSIIAKEVTVEEAESLKALFEELGATIEIQ